LGIFSRNSAALIILLLIDMIYRLGFRILSSVTYIMLEYTKLDKMIVHVDMDAFFASIEQRDHPEYQGKPVIVGADPKGGKGRGVVSACSYEARRYGIHSAMPISFAFRRCPHGVFLPVKGKKYAQESKRIFSILNRFTPDIEPISIDEAFLDITGSASLFGGPEAACLKIKEDIKKITGLTASLGMAPIKMAAKIASDLDKPDGLVIVHSHELNDFLRPLPVSRLWGVGKKTQESLCRLGIRTIGDLAARDKNDLIQLFGKSGLHLWKLANGIDSREVKTSRETKSIGNEHTFSQDERNKDTILDTLMQLSEHTSRRLRKAGFRGRTITLKIRFSDFTTHTRSHTLDRQTHFTEEIFRSCAERIKHLDAMNNPVRLIGVQVSNLVQNEIQLDLLPLDPPEQEKKERLTSALDEIKDRFGENAIKRRKS
jgi:nucleotidyltransferase/DNA polymerase involved in DNA repair